MEKTRNDKGLRRSEEAKKKVGTLENELKKDKTSLKNITERENSKISSLIDTNGELKAKLKLQQRINEDLGKVKKAHEACGDTSSGEKVKKLQKKLAQATKLLRSKDIELMKQSSTIIKLTFADSEDGEESSGEADNNMEDNEYMEFADYIIESL